MGDWAENDGGWQHSSDGPPQGLRYSRFVPGGIDPDPTIAHVRAHLSSVADSDDDPDTHAADVQINLELHVGGVLVGGALPDTTASAPYLDAEHDPYADVDPDLRREVLDG